MQKGSGGEAGGYGAAADMSMYTKEALIRSLCIQTTACILKWPKNTTLISGIFLHDRRRNRLKKHPKINSEIEGFWNLLENLRTGDLLCLDNYTKLNLCCSKAFTRNEEWDIGEAKNGAAEDWENDCDPGAHGVTYEGFFNAIFELIDIWAPGFA